MANPANKAVALNKSSARIMAVQALYQEDMNGELEDGDPEILAEKISGIYQGNKDLKLPAKVDQKLLNKLIEGSLKKKTEIDNHIKEHLNAGWDMERLGPTMRSILRLAVYELKFEETPIGVIIKEYIQLTDQFVGEKETKFVNGILDKIAHKLRG